MFERLIGLIGEDKLNEIKSKNILITFCSFKNTVLL